MQTVGLIQDIVVKIRLIRLSKLLSQLSSCFGASNRGVAPHILCKSRIDWSRDDPGLNIQFAIVSRTIPPASRVLNQRPPALVTTSAEILSCGTPLLRKPDICSVASALQINLQRNLRRLNALDEIRRNNDPQ
jgi:hypothetical protein